MSARAVMLRRNLAELLPEFDDHDIGVVIEAVADEIEERHRVHALSLRRVAWWLTGFYVGGCAARAPIFSGACSSAAPRGHPSRWAKDT